MNALQISPTLLNTFRQVTVGEYNLSSQHLLEYLTGEYKINPASSRGWAYHKLIEDGPEKYEKFETEVLTGREHSGSEIRTWYEIEDKRVKDTPWTEDFDPVWKFTEAAAEPAIQEHKRYKEMIREAWVDYNTTVQGEPIRIRMRVDGLNGSVIEEYKTSKSAGRYERYLNSLQWQCYLEAMPDCTEVCYTHIQIGTKNDWSRVQKFSYKRGDYSSDSLQQWIEDLVIWLSRYPDICDRLKREDKNPLPF